MDYSAYEDLKIRRLEPGILEITMGEPGKLAVATARAHAEMARVWLDVDRDPDTRVAVLRGAGKGFSAGGDMAMVEEMTRDFAVRARVWREARDLVYNMLNCSKLIVSAMHGPAVGAGLAAGLMADISIAAKNARLIDGHTRLVPAAVRDGDRRGGRTGRTRFNDLSGRKASGDCAGGRAQARRRPADRAALDEIQFEQLAAHGGALVRASLALEMMGFTGPEVKEGLAALREKRNPSFPPEPKNF
jgi:enoyl-CoA hydratase